MFEKTSRYYNMETALYIRSDGKQISYKKRRFLPHGESMDLLQEITINEGDRLDQITARQLGDPEYFWLICDANNVMDPFQLLDLGRTIRIPEPNIED